MDTTNSPNSRRRPERGAWIGHNAWWIQIAFSAAMLASIYVRYASQLVRGEMPLPQTNDWNLRWFDFILLPALLGIMYWLAHRQHKHDRQLCVRCAEITPLDPEAAVHKHRRALRITHGPGTLQGLIMALILALVGIAAFAIAAFIDMPWWMFGIALTIVVGGGGIVFPWTDEWHRRLAPWCPQCRDDDGWDGDAVVEPSPDPQIKADR